MRRASTFTAAALAATGVLVLADAASAQSAPAAGEARGLRYLSWPGRGESADSRTDDPARPAVARADLRRPNPVIPHGGFAAAEPPPPRGPAPAAKPARRTLTPANAWLQPPAAAPEAAPALLPAPPPPAYEPPPPPPPPAPEYLPDQGGRGQPAPAKLVYSAPARPDEPPAAPADPMAPRRDAPIFRMQRTPPPPPPPEAGPAAGPSAEAPQPRRVVEVAPSGERPAQQGARYYSVHRQNGREPDALVMPAPTYVDALVVSMTETPATQDLAEPSQGPTLIRDRNGAMRAAPAASDGDHQ